MISVCALPLAGVGAIVLNQVLEKYAKKEVKEIEDTDNFGFKAIFIGEFDNELKKYGLENVTHLAKYFFHTFPSDFLNLTGFSLIGSGIVLDCLLEEGDVAFKAAMNTSLCFFSGLTLIRSLQQVRFEKEREDWMKKLPSSN